MEKPDQRKLRGLLASHTDAVWGANPCPLTQLQSFDSTNDIIIQGPPDPANTIIPACALLRLFVLLFVVGSRYLPHSLRGMNDEIGYEDYSPSTGLPRSHKSFTMVRFRGHPDALILACRRWLFTGCGNRDKINSRIALTRVSVCDTSYRLNS